MSSFLGCANVPTGYNQAVKVIDGLYAGEYGKILKDCAGFEMYLVYLYSQKTSMCFRIWDLERL